MKTIEQQLVGLVNARNTLADNLTARGQDSTHEELFSDLVPKVLDVHDELTGDASPSDVIAGKTFYSSDSTDKQTGTLAPFNGIGMLRTSESVSNVIYSSAEDENYIYIGSTYITKFDKLTLAAIAASPGYGGSINSLIIKDGYIYAAGANVQTICKYNLSDLSFVAESPSYGGNISLEISGDYIYASGSVVNAIRKYNLSDLNFVAESSAYSGEIRTLNVSGNYIFAMVGATIYKFELYDLSYVSEYPTDSSVAITTFTIKDDYIYIMLNKIIYKYSISDFSLVAESLDLGYSSQVLAINDGFIYAIGAAVSSRYKIRKYTLSDLSFVTESPIAATGSSVNSFVVVTEMVDKDGYEIIVPIHLNKLHKRLSVNRIASVYGKNNIENYVATNIQNGNLLDVDKKISQEWFTNRGLQLPKLVQTILDSKTNISQNNTSVNNNISENKENDTKYSLKPNTEEGRKALEENARLREANENLKREFTLTKGNRLTDKSAANKLASGYSRDYNIKGSTEEISRNIQQSFNLINGMARDNLSWDAVQDITGLLAEKILDKAVYVDDTIYQQYSDLRKYLRTTKISISSTDKSSIADFNDFRKQNIGRLRLSQDGTSVDVIWQELAENYPEFFDENDTLHPADKLQYIADLSKSLDKSYKEFKTTVEYDTAKKMLSNQLWEDYLDTPQEKKTYADKVQEKLMLEKAHSAARLRELRSSKNENIARLKADNISRVNAVISRERTRSEDKQKQIKAHAKEIFDNYRDRRNKTSFKDKVWKKTRDLHKILTNPTEKKYVSEEMKKPIAEFLESVVNAYKTDTGTIAEIKRDKMINAYRKMIENTDSEFTYDFDEDMLDMIDSIPDKKIADMTAAEIENLNRVIVSLTKTVTESNRLRRIEKYKDITDAGNRIINDLAALKSKSNVANEIVDKIDNMVNSDMLQPREFFEQFGDVGLSIYNEFRNALDKKIINIKNAQDYMANLIKEKNISEWTGKKSHATKFNVSGGEIELTPAQVMYLYLLSEREQAQNHIYVGGIKQAPVIATYTEKDGKGKNVKKEKIKSNSAPVKVSPEDVANIINTLTSEQKTVADGIGKFLTETTSEWANEVSLEMYGYKKFTEKKYIPMKSDENYLKSEFGVQRDGTIKNAGWTKSTVRKANNPLIIEDIFDVFTRQADEASTYNAFVVPLSDMQKIMNYKNTEGSVKQSVQQKFGSSANAYIAKFANDINGGIRTEPGTGIVKILLRNYKSAAMGLNARVIIQQPTALIRASALINPKYLIKGIAGKVSFDEVKKHAPIAQWKDLGYFTTDTGRQMRDIFLNKKELSDYTMAGIAKADNMAWRVLWNAVEAETKDLHSDIEYGSDKYYEICRDRFNYITDKTQVVDTVLHRSQLTRSNDTAVKVYSSFMSEPIKTYNLLRSVYRNYIIDKTPGNSKKVRQTSIAFVATSAATAFMCTLADLWRSDDEDEKFWEIYFGNLVNDATGMIPILRDITSIANGFSPKRMEYSGFEKLGYAFKRFNKNIKALQAGQPPQYTWSQVTSDFARGLGELTGIPANSTFREIEAIYDNIANASKSYEMKYARQKMSYNIRNEDNAGKFKKILWGAYSEGSPEVAQPILNDMLANGYVKADLFAYIESELRKQARTDPVMNDLYQSWKSSDKDSIGKFLEKAKKKGYSDEQISYGFDYLRDEDKLTYGSPKKIYAFIQSGQKKKAAEMFNAMIESGLWTEEEIDSGYEKYASQTKSDVGLE